MRKVTAKERKASARQVREIRATLGLGVVELAGRAGVSVWTVLAWEAARRVPSEGMMDRLSALRP